MFSLKKILIAGTAACALAPAMASAAGGSGGTGKYFAVGAGLTVPDDAEQATILAPFSVGSTTTQPAGFDTGFDPGFNVGALVGNKFNDYWRVEAEFRYSSADIDVTTARGTFNAPIPTSPNGTTTANSGDVSVASFFVNGILDINMAGRLTPYLGAGLGYADVDVSAVGADSGEGVVAYQVITGADFQLDDKSWLGARFNFMWTDDFAYDPVGLSNVGGAYTLDETEYSAFDLTVAYRRTFKLGK